MGRDEPGDRGSRVNRRDLLKGLGVAGTSGAIGYAIGDLTGDTRDGDPSSPRDPSEPTVDDQPTQGPVTDTEEPGQQAVRHADAYPNVIDAVDAGADPNGTIPINALLEKATSDGTLVSFPKGTYRIDPLRLEDLHNVAIAGATEERPTFVATRDVCLDLAYLRFQNVSDFLFDGIDLDFTRRGAGGEFRVVADGDVTVQNVEITGNCNRQIAGFRMDVTDPNGVGLVKNLRAHHRATTKLTGFFVGESHAGEVTFEDCDVSGFSDNGLYASAMGLPDGGDGAVHAVGGSYVNNNISGVRLGSTGSTARNVDVVVDTVPSGDDVNARGIRLRNRRDILVENCSVTFGPDAGESFGALVVHGDNGGAHVRDSTLNVDADMVPAIHAFEPNKDETDPLVFENLAVTGSAAGSYAATITGRDETSFENCTFEQSGKNRGGIRLADSAGCRIVDSHIEATRNPVVASDGDVLVQNTTIVTPAGTRHVKNAVVENSVLNPK
ncbi:twin-arginine translocation signal domain-containing protein [Halorubellus sp. PRR65]|uniref:twin-arginine translocation signal domain-containing protein n=1 Tax=Halorubellus sp. PRR65 TaxID=3098148 RepID=UPI002B2627C4|nr:twin-arginine translocation signal domain-containing protein [Halorubellus sp. PRR65]